MIGIPFVSYVLRMCDVCAAYYRLSFRIYGVSATYVWRNSRINGECCTYVLHVHTFAVEYVFHILCRSKSIWNAYLGLGFFRATFTVTSVFVKDISRTWWGALEMFLPPIRSKFLWFHLRPVLIYNCNARIASTKWTQPFFHTQLVQNRYATDKNGT